MEIGDVAVLEATEEEAAESSSMAEVQHPLLYGVLSKMRLQGGGWHRALEEKHEEEEDGDGMDEEMRILKREKMYGS